MLEDEVRPAGYGSLTRGMLLSWILLLFAPAASAQLQFSELSGLELPTDSDATFAIALGDVDGDGDLDMVLGTYNGQNRLYLNDGAGVFADVTAMRMPFDKNLTYDVALGDVDKDGDLDIVFGNGGVNGAEQNILCINDGTGNFSDRRPIGTDLHKTSAVALSDVDGDGDLDLVVGNVPQTLFRPPYAYGGEDYLYLNDGTGSFTITDFIPPSTTPCWRIEVGDVDGDGDPDLLMTNPTVLYRNDGTGRFAKDTTNDLWSSSAWGADLGDVDGDGDLDIVIGAGLGQNRLFLNDGTGAFADATARLPSDSMNTWTVALGDVDEDGDSDLVLGNLDEPNGLYLNDGTGHFTDVSNRMAAGVDPTFAVALGDGDTDAVFGNHTAQSRLHLNLIRQLHTPLVIKPGSEFRLDAYARYGSLGSSHTALPFLSTATASIPLPPFGRIGIEPSLAVGLAPVDIPQPAGVGSASLTVPNDPSLVGLWVYAQALLLQFPKPLLTNVTADEIVR